MRLNIEKNCQLYSFNFPEPSSLRDIFLNPLRVVDTDNTVTEWIQRSLIDYSPLNKAACKRGLQLYTVDSREPIPFTATKWEKTEMCRLLDPLMFAESLAGRFVYDLTTSAVLRSIELFSQGARNSLGFSALSPRTKQILNFLILPAAFKLTCSLGYKWEDVVLNTLIPVAVEKVWSFKSTNWFKQIHTLSSNKNFELKDFIFKNIQVGISLLLIAIVKTMHAYSSFVPRPTCISFCQNGKVINQGKLYTYYNMSDFFLQPLAFLIGKMIFDLSYILILKTLSPNADLRDPMGWIFSMMSWMLSKLKPQTTPAIPAQVQKSSSPKNIKKTTLTNASQNENQSKEALKPELNIELPESKDDIIKIQQPKHNKKINQNKVKAQVKIDKLQSVAKKNTTVRATETQTEINIEVDGRIHTFQKMESPLFINEVWAVIITNSIEKQKLKKYEQFLSNGTIGGGIRKLSGPGNHYEIGANMDSRLIGTLYHTGMYNALQEFMHMEDALQMSQELERNGIQDHVSLLAFSAEAKKHQTITRVAKKLSTLKKATM